MSSPLLRGPMTLVLPHPCLSLPLKAPLEPSPALGEMQLVLNIPSREVAARREVSRQVESPPAPPLIAQLGTEVMGAESLAELLQSGNLERTLIIDSRSFVEYNQSHILRSKNVVCSKLVKRRLLQNKMTIKELLENSCKMVDVDPSREVIVYDQNTRDLTALCPDDFLSVLLTKLHGTFRSVSVLEGGFEAFQSCFPYLCETQERSQCPTIAQLSQPCITSVGPTKVLSHLYLGSQQDVLDENLLQQNGINYVLNISRTCPAPSYIPANHFLRIPVKDNYGETILSWLDDAIQFIDKVKSANGKVIVHCLAGISRSPTVAIAYIMKRLNMTNETAYRFVKSKRPTISPNFNFLGQLIEYEKLLQNSSTQTEPIEGTTTVPVNVSLSSTYQLTCTLPPQTGDRTTSLEGESAEKESADEGNQMETGNSPTIANSKTPPTPPRRLAQPQRSRSKSPRPSLPKVTLSPSSTTSGQSKSQKRSISEKPDSPELPPSPCMGLRSGLSLPNISQSVGSGGSGSIQRPSGLNLTKVVSHHDPVFLQSPGRGLRTESNKKPRSGNTTPVGLGVLEWGTSKLSVNSPMAGSGNPFVDACERFQAQSRIKVEEKLTLSPGSVTGDNEDDHVISGGQNTQVASSLVTRQFPPSGREEGGLDGVEHSLPPPSLTQQGTVQQISNRAKDKQSSSHRTSPGRSILKKNITKNAKLDFSLQANSMDSEEGHTGPSSGGLGLPKPATTKTQKGVLRNLPHHLRLRIRVSPSKQECSPTSMGCIPPSSLVRQESCQSFCSESSASSGISPNLESDASASSVLDRHNSLSSGISPDMPSSVGAPDSSSCSPSKSLHRGWNPFRFPSKRGDEESPSENVEEGVWQKQRPDSLDSLSSGGSTSSPKLPLRNSPSRNSSSPATAMDRGGLTYFARCKFDPEERRDSWDSASSARSPQKKCNSSRSRSGSATMATKVLSVRSQSCEEISSCAREAVVSEMVRSSRENLLQYGLTRFEDDDFETCSLSSERSLSSSCEMIEVS